MVRRMAGDATDVVLAVYRVNGVHVLSATGVAGQATGVDFFRRSRLEDEDLGFVAAARNVVRTWSVAALATLLRGATFRVEGGLPVRRFLPVVIDFLVAGFAGLRPQVFGDIGRRSTGGGCAGRLNVLGRNLRASLLGSESGDEKKQNREEKRSRGSGARWH
jgi:hypothetical protein